MRAIAGIYRPSGPLVSNEIGWMLDRMNHWGPDSTGAWCDRQVALGHRMPSTAAEPHHEKSPLTRSSPRLAITADARIDNRSDLIRALDLTNNSPEGIPDSELILAAYERWGEQCVGRLLGDFAFAVWDSRKQQLFCARDHFGVKPFFYHRSDNLFAFATEAGALFAVPGVPHVVHEGRIGDYLTGTFEDKELTFFKDILRLPPAHTLTVGPEGARLRRYWELDPEKGIRRASDAEYAEEFRSLFTEAIRCRMRSEFPLGVMLSGGLDSSSVACLARDLLSEAGRGDLHTFSAVFDSIPECNERPYIETVLRTGGFAPHFLHADLLSPFEDFDSVLGELGEPFHRLNITLQRSAFQMAEGAGVRVMLDGLGGDTVLSHGIASLWELARNRRWAELGEQLEGLERHFHWDRRTMMRRYLSPSLSEMRDRGEWLALAAAYARIPFQMGCGVPQFYLDYGLRPLGRKVKRMILGRPTLPRRSQHRLRSIVAPDFAQRIRLEDRQRQIRALHPDDAKTERQSHHAQLNSGRTALALEEFGRVATPFRVEVRYPHYDKRLVEFCLALPPEQKLRQGWSRMILRRAMEGILPEEIRWRGGKGDLLLPFHRTLRKYGRNQMEKAIRHTPAGAERYLDMAAVRDAYRQYETGDDTEGRIVWAAAVLIAWLHKSGFALSRMEERERSPVPCN